MLYVKMCMRCQQITNYILELTIGTVYYLYVGIVGLLFISPPPLPTIQSALYVQQAYTNICPHANWSAPSCISSKYAHTPPNPPSMFNWFINTNI